MYLSLHRHWVLMPYLQTRFSQPRECTQVPLSVFCPAPPVHAAEGTFAFSVASLTGQHSSKSGAPSTVGGGGVRGESEVVLVLIGSE